MSYGRILTSSARRCAAAMSGSTGVELNSCRLGPAFGQCWRYASTQSRQETSAGTGMSQQQEQKPEAVRNVLRAAMGAENDPIRGIVGGNPERNTQFFEVATPSLSLSERVQMQTLTHKTYKHGSEPYNQKLAVFGRRILRMHIMTHKAAEWNFSAGEHRPSIENLPMTGSVIPAAQAEHFLTEYFLKRGLEDLVRWKPRNKMNLKASGADKIYIESACAILGAIAIEHGLKKAFSFLSENVKMDV